MDHVQRFVNQHRPGPIDRDTPSMQEKTRCRQVAKKPLVTTDSSEPLTQEETKRLVDLLRRLYDYPRFHDELGISATRPSLPPAYLLSRSMAETLRTALKRGNTPDCQTLYNG